MFRAPQLVPRIKNVTDGTDGGKPLGICEKTYAPVPWHQGVWSGWDLNPRSFDYESSALTN